MPLTLTRERVEETTTRYVYPRPITFDEWLDNCEPGEFFELVDGTLVEKPMVHLDHEKLNLWLLHVLGLYSRRRDIGTVLGTRSPVLINEFRGRIPDLFFVRKEREGILGQKATTGPPDLVIEIVSPGDRRADINATEADYRSIGVAEIVYIDQHRHKIRVLRRHDDGYSVEDIDDAALSLQAMGGVTLQWNWLFVEPRPDEIDTVLALLAGQ